MREGRKLGGMRGGCMIVHFDFGFWRRVVIDWLVRFVQVWGRVAFPGSTLGFASLESGLTC